MRWFISRLWVVLTMMSVLSACAMVRETAEPEPGEAVLQPPPTAVAPPAAAAPPKAAAERPETAAKPPAPKGRVYVVDGAASLLEILVYRSGSLAHLGHNHIISSKELRGSVALAPDIGNSRVDLRLPLAGLVVDDPSLRKQAGKDFESVPSEADIENTRNNMLGDKVLNAKRFPEVRIQATVAGGKLPVLELATRVRLHGTSRAIKVPVRIERKGGLLRANGTFKIRQSDFGIKSFSVLMGALKVKDELTIRFRIVARSPEPGTDK